MAPQTRGWTLIGVVFVIFTIIGCGSEKEATTTAQKESDQKSSAKLIEPCELITKTEAEAIMGVALKAGQRSENEVVGQKMCLYEAADENSFLFLNVSLTQNAFIPPEILASGQTAQSIFSTIKEAFPDRETVDGTGDDAFVATPGIHILKGDYYLVIGAGNIDQHRDELKIAGDKVISKLETLLK